MTDFMVFFDPDGCFLVLEQAAQCGQCGNAHYLFRNVGGKTLCLECAGPVADSLSALKDAIALGYLPRDIRSEAARGNS